MVRLCGALVTPLRFLGAALLVFGLVGETGNQDTVAMLLVAALGGICLVLSQVCRNVRWPPLPRYLRVADNVRRPRDWAPDDQRSDSNAVWVIVRLTVEPWIKARRNPLHRSANRPRLDGVRLSPAGESLDRIGLPDLAGPCEAISRRLSPAERDAARRQGVLPSWFWQELGDSVSASRS